MVYMLLGTGFEETEAITPLDLLRRANIPVQTVGLNGKIVYGGHNIGVEADITLGQMDLTNMDMIVLPGGLGGVTSVRASKEAMDVHSHGNITRAGKVAGVAEPMLLITDAQGNIVASKTITADLTISGTLTAAKIVGAVYA